jgi:hypothetical protein
MPRTAYLADKEIEERLFCEADIELYSAAQVTDLVAADFIEFADADAEFYLVIAG